jgi:hypothetical protein
MCQEAVSEDLACCERCGMWARESRAGYCEKDSHVSFPLYKL